MSTELQALVALDDEVDRGLVETLVSGGGRLNVLDYLELGGPTASGSGAGDVLIIACADYNGVVKEYISAAARQHSSRPVILLCPAGSNGVLGEAFSLGVDDIVPLPAGHGSSADAHASAQLVFSVEKAVARKCGTTATRPTHQGRLICVLGLKGGSGKTLTTANVGVSLAAAGAKVAMIDLDLQFGDLGLTLGVPPERTIYDLIRSSGSLDLGKLEDFMVEHSSGARVLLAPVRPDQAGLVSVQFLLEVQRLLREAYEFVLIDTPPSFTPEVISLIDASTDILVVAMRDTLSLKNTKLGLETLERMDYDRRQMRIVLNRANTNVGIERQDVLAILGRDVDVLVPSDRDVTRSVNQGSPIALKRGAAAGKAFRALAQLYLDDADKREDRPAPEDRPAAVAERQPDAEDPPPAAIIDNPNRRRMFRWAS